MADIFHQWGEDLVLGPTGDLAIVSGAIWGQQRVLRRLMTNPQDYLWHTDYGAGLAQFIGQPAKSLQIRAAARSQIFKESAVARSPEPTINVLVSPSGPAGAVYVQLQYVNSEVNQTQVLTFNVNA